MTAGALVVRVDPNLTPWTTEWEVKAPKGVLIANDESADAFGARLRALAGAVDLEVQGEIITNGERVCPILGRSPEIVGYRIQTRPLKRTPA